jgi:phosphatidylglycerol---prolipoprotein diacylglyceryl transferase
LIQVPTDPSLHLLFDAAAWGTGIATGVILYRWRLAEVTAKVARIADRGYFLALAAGAVSGAYLSGSFTFWSQGIFALAHSVAGALVGAIAAMELYKLAKGIRLSTGIIFVGPFAAGIVVGRWGCLFAGPADQTFGTPTSLPWAMDIGDGIARHPVQAYESLAMLAFLLLFLTGLNSRARWAMRDGFYWMAIAYGVQRFAWEFLKPYPAFMGPLNHFHLLCLALVAYGIVMLRRQPA